MKGCFLKGIVRFGDDKDDFFASEIFFKGLIGLCLRQVLDGQVIDRGLKLKPRDEEPQDEGDDKEKKDNGKGMSNDEPKP